MFWKTRCVIAWLFSAIAILVITSGIIFALILAVTESNIFVDVYKNPLAAFGLLCLPMGVGILIHMFGMVVTGTTEWFPSIDKNPA